MRGMKEWGRRIYDVQILLGLAANIHPTHRAEHRRLAEVFEKEDRLSQIMAWGISKGRPGSDRTSMSGAWV